MTPLKNMTEDDFDEAHDMHMIDGVWHYAKRNLPETLSFPDGDAGEPLDAEDIAFLKRVCWRLGFVAVCIIGLVCWAAS